MLEEVDSFEYLGSVVAANGGVEADVGSRVAEASKAMGALRRVLKNRGMSLAAKRGLYEGVIVPTVLYGAEAWSTRVAERKKLNVFEMKCLRSMIGVTRMDRLRNETVRQRVGITTELSERVDARVLRWFGHMERMPEERLVKKIVNADVEGRRARGRPRMGWMEAVKRALSERGLTMEDGRERARDRAEWRMIVNG